MVRLTTKWSIQKSRAKLYKTLKDKANWPCLLMSYIKDGCILCI